jgi:ethanolamine utilization protein EutQ (cupin superfamily)
MISVVNEINAGELAVGYLHYSEETPTPWTLNRNVVDQIQASLSVICANEPAAKLPGPKKKK